MEDSQPQEITAMERPTSSSGSSVDSQPIEAPVPVRPALLTRKSTNKMTRTEELKMAEEELRPMSPRRTNEDLEAMGKEARDELERHAKALQDSLLAIFHHIEAVKEEHDKLDNNNKFLQKYIGDLMTTSKITATSGRSKK